MNPDILIPILTLSAISVGAGLLLNHFGESDKFDERQQIERGRAANLAMCTAMVYLLGIYCGYSFDLLPMEYGAIFAVYGLTVVVLVSDGYCIFHDALLNRDQEPGPEAFRGILLGGVWLSLALFRRSWDITIAWVNCALGLCWLLRGVMILLRALILRLREKRDE